MSMLNIMAILMMAVVIILILTKIIPMNFTLFLVPIVIALFLGFTPTEVATMSVNQFNTTMQASGYMLIFGLLYFSMLTETGMFDKIVGGITKIIGSKMNMIVIMILTIVIAAVGMLTANISTCYLVTIPIMMPLYRKYKFNRVHAFILIQTALSAMCFIPWGVGIALSSMMAGCDTMELAIASIPWALCFIPVLIGECVYFAILHKKEVGTFGLPAGAEAASVETQEEKVNENARPKLFWVNLILFIAVIVALAVFKLPSYFIFIIAACITALVNYPKNFGEMWNKTGTMIFNIILMLLSISVYIAVFSQTGMVESFAELVVSIFPGGTAKYAFLVLLAICVPVIRFVPYQLYNAMYPLLISIGAQFGYSAIQIVAPFVCNIALATGVTPVNASIYVAGPLLDTEVDSIVKKGVPIMTIVNIVVILLAIVTGIQQL